MKYFKIVKGFSVILIISALLTGCLSNNTNTPNNDTDVTNDSQINEDTSKPEKPDPEPEAEPAVLGFTVKHGEQVVFPGESYNLDILWMKEVGIVEPADLQQLTLSLSGVDNNEVVLDAAKGFVTIQQDAVIGSSFEVHIQYEDLQKELSYKIKYSLTDTLEDTQADIPVVTNPDHSVVIVNKQRSLPYPYVPEDLVVPDVPFSFDGFNEKKQLRKVAADALEQLFAQAAQDDIELYAVSGYRSYERQKFLFEYNVEQNGEEHARRYSAFPGTSEHQTGLTMDVSSLSVGNALLDTFGNTAEGLWLAENAQHHGFIIRYPEGKEEITGYAYEPWHIRYVGKEVAVDIYEAGSTLEEYFTEAIPVGAN